MTIVIRGSPFEAIYGFGDALWHVHADVHGIPCPNRHCWRTSTQNARSAGEDAQRSLAGILGTLRRRRLAVVRGNCGSVDDPWAVDLSRTDRRQPADAHVTDWDLLGSELGCRRRSTDLRAFVLHLADVLREESLVGGSVHQATERGKATKRRARGRSPRPSLTNHENFHPTRAADRRRA